MGVLSGLSILSVCLLACLIAFWLMSFGACCLLLAEDLAVYWSTDTVVFMKHRAWRKKENERLSGMM